MSYKPYKKDIKFVDSITSHPEYKQARKVITATADDKFREWLLLHLKKASLGELAGYDNKVLPEQLFNTLSALVARKVAVDENTLKSAQTVFFPKPDLKAITLVNDMMKSLLDIQTFERKLRKVEVILKSDKPKRSYNKTRDGKKPKYQPKKKQIVKYK